MLKGLVLVLLLAFVGVCRSSSDDSSEAFVRIKDGLIQGAILPQARAFRGVPFAAPPVGELRWELPQPPESWGDQTWDATDFRAGCPQICTLPPLTCPLFTSEDCLYLNVWTPRLQTGAAPYPVLIFLAGGHFDQGTAEDLLYDSELWVNATNAIIVEPNYRLGALGFLATEELSGNFGFYDQRLAFQWVINNIAAFGGDPKQVTIFGQSAGGTSTASHIVSKDSQGLFQRAIIESNPWGLPQKSMSQARAIGDRFKVAVGCEFQGLKCLKALNVSEVVRGELIAEKFIPIYDPVELFYPFTPVVDGVDIVENPLDAFMAGNYNHNISIISGTVTNESLMFVIQAFPDPLPLFEYKAIISALFPGNEDAIMAQYPIPKGTADTRPFFSILGTDFLFTCPQRAMARGVAKFSDNIWMYFYNHTLSFYQAWGPNYTECYTGVVCHASELPLVFQSAKDGNYTFSPDEVVLSQEIGFYWTNFAKTGNPNEPVPQQVNWPQYQTETSIDLQFNTPSFTESFIFSDNCDFWDNIGYKTDFWDILLNFKYQESS